VFRLFEEAEGVDFIYPKKFIFHSLFHHSDEFSPHTRMTDDTWGDAPVSLF